MGEEAPPADSSSPSPPSWQNYISSELPRTVQESAHSAIQSARSIQQSSSTHLRTLKVTMRTCICCSFVFIVRFSSLYEEDLCRILYPKLETGTDHMKRLSSSKLKVYLYSLHYKFHFSYFNRMSAFRNWVIHSLLVAELSGFLILLDPHPWGSSVKLKMSFSCQHLVELCNLAYSFVNFENIILLLESYVLQFAYGLPASTQMNWWA